MLINVAFQDGFADDEVVMAVDGAEAFREDGVTTRTQISHAVDTQVEVPDRPFTLEVDVPTQGTRESFQVNPDEHQNVAISVVDGQLVAAFPEQLGFV